MIVYVTALFECGWCGATAFGAKPERPETEPTTPPEGWHRVYSTEKEKWAERKKGVGTICLCMDLMDVMCDECWKRLSSPAKKTIYDSEINSGLYGRSLA